MSSLSPKRNFPSTHPSFLSTLFSKYPRIPRFTYVDRFHHLYQHAKIWGAPSWYLRSQSVVEDGHSHLKAHPGREWVNESSPCQKHDNHDISFKIRDSSNKIMIRENVRLTWKKSVLVYVCWTTKCAYVSTLSSSWVPWRTYVGGNLYLRPFARATSRFYAAVCLSSK